MLGGAGDDTIGILGVFNTANSIEQFDGGAGLNIIRGGTVNDNIDFSATALLNIARIEGGSGNDTITGSAGSDTIVGGVGNDVLNGGNGDDTFTVAGTGDGFDAFNGGIGFDRILGSAGDDTIGLTGSFGVASSIEQIDGGTGVNTILGTTNADSMNFSATTLTNISRIDGGSGNDTIVGSAGNDTIVGGISNDMLSGGAGSDTFAFATGSGLDTITDLGGGDRLRFDGFSTSNLVLQQQGANVLVQFAGNSLRVTLQNTDVADLGYSMGSGSEAGAVIVTDNHSLS